MILSSFILRILLEQLWYLASLLIATDNCGVWSGVMIISRELRKNEVLLMELPRNQDHIHFLSQRERCKGVAFAWIMNSVAKQLYVGILYSMIRSERDLLVTLPSCACETSKEYLKHNEQQNVLQFLIGLNYSYMTVWSQIFTLSQVYSLVNQEETKNGIIFTSAQITYTSIEGHAFFSEKKNVNKYISKAKRKDFIAVTAMEKVIQQKTTSSLLIFLPGIHSTIRVKINKRIHVIVPIIPFL